MASKAVAVSKAPKKAVRPKAAKKTGAAKKIGRPLALVPDAATIARVKGLGMIQATHREMEKVLGVSIATLEKFLAIPEVRAALEAGQAEGLTSLRRKQFAVALAGNPTMLIWLGKNHLGQTDKTEFSGPDGDPVNIVFRAVYPKAEGE